MIMSIFSDLSLGEGGLIAGIVTVITTFLGGFIAKYKGKLGLAIKLAKQAIEAAEKLENALEDDKITAKEIEGLKQELSEVKEAWKALTVKKVK